MKFITSLFKGIASLITGSIKLFFRLLKKPQYLALLLVLFFAGFSVFGVKPREVPSFIAQKFETIIASRKEGYLKDFALLSDKVKDTLPDSVKSAINQEKAKEDALKEEELQKLLKQEEEQALEQVVEPLSVEEHIEQIRLSDTTSDWQNSFKEEVVETPQEKGSFVEGSLIVISPTTLKVAGQKFTLKGVRLLSGQAGAAYSDMQKKFSGLKTRCYFNEAMPNQADCFADDIDLGLFLIDYGYAQQVE